MTDQLYRAFKVHRLNAFERGIPWNFQYWEWLQIWQDSGHLEDRGNKGGQWVMARHGDAGAYEAGNVKITRVEKNASDGQKVKRHRRHREAHRAGFAIEGLLAVDLPPWPFLPSATCSRGMP